MFEKEISYLKNEHVRNSAKVLVGLLPDYFYRIAASSTGKYHPSFSLGEGGLYRHSKAAATIGYELLKIEMYRLVYTDIEKDLIVLALMVHDGLKLGLEESKYTKFEHPILMANFVRENKDKMFLSDEEVEIVASAIETHMGEFIYDYQGREVLKKPKTKIQKFVHMCDYLASRKFLNVCFNDKNEIEGVE